MDPADQRRYPRAAIRGVARIADARGDAELLAVRDLSHRGLRLTGFGGVPRGADVRLEVRLFNQPFVARGRVVWVADAPHAGLGVELAPSAEVTELCDELETRMALRRLRGRALLVEADPSRAALLAEYLWSHGYEVDEVTAPLSAIERLELGEVALIAIGPDLSTCSGAEFATFVAENFPRVHRLVVAATGRGTNTHDVVGSFEPERPVTAVNAVVCDEAKLPIRRH